MPDYQCDFLITLRGKILASDSVDWKAQESCQKWLQPEVFERLLGCRDVDVLTLELSKAVPREEV